MITGAATAGSFWIKIIHLTGPAITALAYNFAAVSTSSLFLSQPSLPLLSYFF
jgi:hypothetical protein